MWGMSNRLTAKSGSNYSIIKSLGGMDCNRKKVAGAVSNLADLDRLGRRLGSGALKTA